MTRLVMPLTAAVLLAGCMNAPQCAPPGCEHPVAIAYRKVEQFRDGLALEKAQWRSEHDTTELRLIHAHNHAEATADCVKQTAHRTKTHVFGGVRRAWWRIRPRWFCRR